MHTKNALSNLKNRYKAVLKKCTLINTFGTLALAAMLTIGASQAFAAPTVTDNLLSGETATSIIAVGGASIFQNNGTINGGDPLVGYHLGMFNMLSSTSINNGIITINQPTLPNVTGMLHHVSLPLNSDVQNTGSINILGTNAVSGMSTVSSVAGLSHASTNSGTINVIVNDFNSSSAGMYVGALPGGNVTMTNSKDITISSSGAGVANMAISGMATELGNFSASPASPASGNITLSNSGTITVNGGANDGRASGMYLAGDNSFVHNVTNTGFINVTNINLSFGNTAFEVLGRAKYNVNTWALSLYDRNVYDSVFAYTVDDSASVNFANSHLILRPGTASEGFVYGKEYALTNMISAIDGTSTAITNPTSINGAIAKVSTEVDFLEARLNNTDPTKPRLSLVKNEEKLPNAEMASITLATNLEHLKRVSQSVRSSLLTIYKLSNMNESTNVADNGEQVGLSAGSSEMQSKWSVFLTPYASYTDNSKYDYSLDTYGITGGANYNFSQAFSAGFHLNYSAVDSNADDLDGDSSSFAFGAHANYFVNPNWYVGGQATAAFTSDDIEYSISNHSAEDDFNSSAFIATLNTGYIFEINKNNIISPEFALSYLYADMGGYSLNYAAPYDLYNMSIGDSSYSDLYASLTLSWQGELALSKGILLPSISMGLRQSLTGNDFDSRYVMSGIADVATVNMDDTSFTTNAELNWNYNDFTIGASYNGEFGSTQQSHTAGVKFIYSF